MDNTRKLNKLSSHGTSQSKNRQADLSKRQLMPAFRMVLPVGRDISTLQDIFRRTCRRHGFYISESSDTSITGVFSQKSGLFQLLSCFSGEDKPRSASVVKLSVSAQSANRILSIRGLQGTVGKITELIETFKASLDSPFAENRKRPQINGLNSESDEPVFTRQLESYTYYELSKVMSSQDYGVGERIAQFMKEWQAKYSDAHCVELPGPLDEVKSLVDEIVHSLLAHFNIANFSSAKIAQHCKPSVEKYVFSKLAHQISLMYEVAYQDRQREFTEKVDKADALGREQLMKELEIKDPFKLDQVILPYESAIESFNMLQTCQTPLDKLNAVLEGVTLMKTSVLDYWRGKQELSTMDDQLPVLIYIVSQVKATAFVAQIGFLKDYIKESFGFDNEFKILTDVDSAISFIIKELII